MTFPATSKEVTSSAPIWGSHSFDPSASTARTPEYSRASDEELLAAARISDGRAFAELCGRHAGSIEKRILRMLRNREDTEDVLQDAICRALVHLQRFRGTCAFSTWLTRIAINSALMLMRKRRSRSEISFDQRAYQDQEWQVWEFPDRSPNPEQIYAKRQVIERIAFAVDRLSPRYRELVQQFHGTERSLQQTAEKLGIKMGTAKSRLFRARLKIRSSLEKQSISLADSCREPARAELSISCKGAH
jgi:RNA polymerase sigma-70 factor (ECF subfamily)